MSKNQKPENKDQLSPDKERKNGRSKHYSRTKGHNGEREYSRIFREDLGFTFCKTSRQGSRLLDDCGVDLCQLPLNIQIKCGYWKFRPKPDQIFKEMDRKLKDNFPPADMIHTYPKIVIHKLDGKNEYHQMVTMSFSDWSKFLLAYKQVNGL